jgi:hydrogenase nickel incorporation protein HypB
MEIALHASVTAANDAVAAELRASLGRRGILCLNLLSAPGAGKTALIERTVARFAGSLRIAVVEGDPHTDLDSVRVRRCGAEAVQINTLGGCHLDAAMVRRALAPIDLERVDLLIIENVGNLLCPAFWDLGEHLRVVVASLPEGADKPFKYPELFSLAQALVINKLDLEALLETKAADLRRNALQINPRLEVLPLSCTTGEGLEAWYGWLLQRRAAAGR